VGYTALITIDLQTSDEKSRSAFYQELTNRKWYKIKSITTAWSVSFSDDVKRSNAIKVLLNDIDQAKKISKIKLVNYVSQIGLGTIVVGSF